MLTVLQPTTVISYQCFGPKVPHPGLTMYCKIVEYVEIYISLVYRLTMKRVLRTEKLVQTRTLGAPILNTYLLSVNLPNRKATKTLSRMAQPVGVRAVMRETQPRVSVFCSSWTKRSIPRNRNWKRFRGQKTKLNEVELHLSFVSKSRWKREIQNGFLGCEGERQRQQRQLRAYNWGTRPLKEHAGGKVQNFVPLMKNLW